MKEKRPIGYIYMFTNRINGKKYIGQHEFKDGIDENYFGSGKNNKNGGFYGAKEKYGLENFKFDILCFCNNKEELDNAESYYVGFKYYTYAKTGRGYNIADGGNGGSKFRGKTEEEMKEIKKKISKGNNERYANMSEKERKEKHGMQGEKNPMYGKHHSEETRKKLSEINKGRTLSEETRKKLSEVRKGRTLSEETRKKLSEVWNNKTEEEMKEIKKKISKANKGRNPYANKTEEELEEWKRKIGDSVSIPVIGINLQTNEIVELNSTIEGVEFGFYSSGISNCCKNNIKSHKGYKWYYKSDYENLSKEDIERGLEESRNAKNEGYKKRNQKGEKNPMYGRIGEKNPFYGKHHTEETCEKLKQIMKDRYKGENNPRARKVKCIETGEEFATVKQASEWGGTHKSCIAKQIKGKSKSAGKHPVTGEKLHWEYVD